MPIPTNNSRPAIPYNPKQVLPNHNRYGTLGKFPPTAQQLDGDFNGVVDLLNTLAGAINDTAAGIFPGAHNPLNANKLPTTDGQGNVSWTHVTPFNLTDNAVHTRHILDAAITPSKIQAQAVGTNQLADGAVATGKILDNAVTTAKMVDGCLTEPKLAEGAVTMVKIKDHAVTIGKISSANAASGDILTADGAGAASFLANKGRILQIVSYEDSRSARNEHDHRATPHNPQSFMVAPFLLRITPQKTNSKILLYYSINVGSGAAQHVCVTLCKNDLPFKVGEGAGMRGDATHSIYNSKGQCDSSAQWGCFNFSSLFVDTGISGTEISYEIKKADPYTTLNSGPEGGNGTISTMHAIEIDL